MVEPHGYARLALQRRKSRASSSSETNQSRSLPSRTPHSDNHEPQTKKVSLTAAEPIDTARSRPVRSFESSTSVPVESQNAKSKPFLASSLPPTRAGLTSTTLPRHEPTRPKQGNGHARSTGAADAVSQPSSRETKQHGRDINTGTLDASKPSIRGKKLSEQVPAASPFQPPSLHETKMTQGSVDTRSMAHADQTPVRTRTPSLRTTLREGMRPAERQGSAKENLLHSRPLKSSPPFNQAYYRSSTQTSPLSPRRQKLRARDQQEYARPTASKTDTAAIRTPVSPKRQRESITPFKNQGTVRDSTSSPLQQGPKSTTAPHPDYTNSLDIDDSSTTSAEDMLERETQLPLATNPEVLDATCLLNGSMVSVQTLGSGPTMSVACVGGPHQELDVSRCATTVLAGLGLSQQVCRIIKCSGSSGSSNKFQKGHNRNIVRYGDAIALCSPLAKNRVLGVRRKEKHQGNSANTEKGHEVGFFRATLGMAEQWTVLWGGSPTSANKRTVLVGSHALQRRKNRDFETKAVVRSVDCILLRNNSTGGLLSFTPPGQGDDELTIVTQSYTSAAAKPSASEGSLLSRLQRHSRMNAGRSEMFQLMHTSVPPCPQWVLCEGNRRFYLDGSYLLYPERNESNTVAGDSRFERSHSQGKSGFFDQEPSNSEPSKHLERTIQEQERLLMDEVIGSMMGLEGCHLQARIHPGSGYGTTKTMDETEFWLYDQGLSVDTSLRNLVERILPLSSSHVRVSAFIATHLPGYEYGSVMQALCEGLDCLLKEYLDFVSRMEQAYRHSIFAQQPSSFTMNKLYVEVRQSLGTMKILEQVVVDTRGLKGGALINALRNLRSGFLAGDDKGRRVLDFLLDRASVPYMNMLTGWMETGVLQDPFGEFMVELPKKYRGFDSRSRNVTWIDYDGDDWEDLYQIREENVLQGLLSSSMIKQQILVTGKCWNAVRYCRRTNRTDDDEEDDTLILEDTSLSLVGIDSESVSMLHYNMDPVLISSQIDRMYQGASKAILELIQRDFSLSQTLVTMKRFFLLDQGDFFVHFLDSAEEELLKEMENVSRGRIQHSLRMSVQLTEGPGIDTPGKPLTPGTFISLKKPSVGHPLTSDELRCGFASESLETHLDGLHAESGGISSYEPKTPARHAYGTPHQGLTGMEAITLDFQEVPFPTSLVISKQSLGSYQLLFRHLFFAKHVERRLVGIWMDHQMMKELQSLRKSLGPTYCLRQRMLHFVQNLIYYMTFEVIEPNWLVMQKAMNGSRRSDDGASQKEAQQTVDDIRQVHSEFLQRTLKECLLTNRDLIRTLTKLLKTCLLFSDQLRRFIDETKISDEHHDIASEKRRVLQRKLNDPDRPVTSQNKKILRQLMVTAREERLNRIRKHTARVQRELSNGSYKRMISRFEEVFSEHLAAFMTELQADSDDRYQSHRTNLCIRLDYNGYVTQGMN